VCGSVQMALNDQPEHAKVLTYVAEVLRAELHHFAEVFCTNADALAGFASPIATRRYRGGWKPWGS